MGHRSIFHGAAGGLLATAAPLVLATGLAAAGDRPAILVTGYWPPSNEMLRRFSANPERNPGGWVGDDWEGRGYDVYSYFPEFNPPNCGDCGRGMGDLEVDYQDTSQDFWPIADGLAPIAVITFSRGFNNMSWELEMNQFNRTNWIGDYSPPFLPTPNPPDDSVPIGHLRPSQLPVEEIVAAVNDANLGAGAFICYTQDGGGFLSEFIAYHGVWYQDVHADPDDAAFCATAGHVHVGAMIPWETARQAAEITIRTVIDYLDQVELMFTFPDGRPRFVEPFGGTRIRVEVAAWQKDPRPGTGKLYYSTGQGFTMVPMDEVAPNVYDAVFPAFDCGARVQYYVSAETVSGEVVLNPFGAPAATYGADAYNAEVISFEDDFEQDLGWTVQNAGGVTGGWERGVPQGGTGAPDADSDGSGQCFVTGLAAGRDLDGGLTRLFSPIMDASDPDSAISFDRWFFTNGTSDFFIIDASDDGGTTYSTVNVISIGKGGWVAEEIRVADISGIENTDQFRLRVRVSDNSPDTTVEAGVDAVRMITGFTCVNPCAEDLDADGEVGFGDLLQLLAAWGPCPDCPEDLDNDGQVGFSDLLVLLAAWGPC